MESMLFMLMYVLMYARHWFSGSLYCSLLRSILSNSGLP